MSYLPEPLFKLPSFGIYVHVPFCAHICPYCDFIKTSRFKKRDIEIFFNALCSQYESLKTHFQENLAGKNCTLYFGGGTPGLFDADYFAPLVNAIRSDFSITEFTVEMNPLSAPQKRLQGYAELGVNRVTVGGQSLCNKTLQTLGRKHTPEQFLNSVTQARSLGIDRVQADLIYGMQPGLRTVSIATEVSHLSDAGATGISGYALTIEPRTLFADGDYSHTEQAIQDYVDLVRATQKVGFRQEETSNFVKKRSHHNHIYWYGRPYMGLGVGAHGYLPFSTENPFGRRYRVGGTPQEHSPGDDKLSFIDDFTDLFKINWEEVRTQTDVLNELLFTLPRTEEGLTWEWLKKICGAKSGEALRANPKIKRALEEGLLLANERSLRLSTSEKTRGDAWTLEFSAILEDFMKEQEKGS